jgi:predicted RNase H-like HicB family nuclease
MQVPQVELKIETEREDDGRWIAEITNMPGVMCYGDSQDSATAAAQALALRVLADQIEHESSVQRLITITCS